MRRLRLLVMASVFVGCSLLGNYDIDGQPCDKSEPNPLLSCLSDAGYVCVAGVCRKDGGVLDAGAKDAGTADAGMMDGGNVGG